MKNTSQKLGLFNFTMIVIGLVIGMGIFRTAKDAAGAALSPALYFTAWILGGIIAWCGALTYAEIGSRFPVTGGYYKIFAYAYHPSLAFALNGSILISNAASIAGVALIGSGYITRVFIGGEASDFIKVIIAMLGILLFYLVNLMGLRMSARTQTLLMIIKIGMILFLISALVMPSAWTPSNTPFFTSNTYSFSEWIQSLGICLVAVSFTYGGYQQTINFGNDVVEPARTIPRAVFYGITAIIVLYLMVNIAYYKVVGFEQMKNAGEIAAIVAQRILGENGGKVFSLLLFLSVLAYVNGTLMSNTRVIFAMSKDGVLPAVFSKQNRNNEVMTTALTAFAVLAIVVLFYADTFEKILSFSIFLDSFGMVTSAATLFLLRKKNITSGTDTVFSLKWFPLQPIVFMAAYVFVCISIIRQSPSIALTGVAVLLAFMVLYFVTCKGKK